MFVLGSIWSRRCCETPAPDSIAHHFLQTDQISHREQKTDVSWRIRRSFLSLMDKQPAVMFRNVGQLYFPQTRVECHYSLTSEHQWTSSDWIGILQVGCSSLMQYHTYTWALAPEGYAVGTSVDYFAVFQPSYLPRPSAVEYQFVYVDKVGKVCARSRAFTFCAPKPLEELEMVKEEQDEEDGEEEEELLLVVPRAQLLQCRLEQCLKKQASLQQDLDEAKKEVETERESSRNARLECENEREAMKEEITELRGNLRQSCEMLKRLEEKHTDVRYSQEVQGSELRKLVAENGENQQKVQDLRDEIKVLADREEQANVELQRLKERVKKMSTQMKHDEEKRKSLQLEIDASAGEVRDLQERLDARDHVAEGLRKELRDLGTQRSHNHAELHQLRLQVAQLTLQLSDQDLALREERATWALEREAYRHAAELDKRKLQDLSCELQRKGEWLQEERTERDNLEAELGREKVLLSEAKRDLQELRAAPRKIQQGREREQLHKQDKKTRLRKPETGDEKQLILPELVNPVLSELADAPMW